MHCGLYLDFLSFRFGSSPGCLGVENVQKECCTIGTGARCRRAGVAHASASTRLIPAPIHRPALLNGNPSHVGVQWRSAARPMRYGVRQRRGSQREGTAPCVVRSVCVVAYTSVSSTAAGSLSAQGSSRERGSRNWTRMALISVTRRCVPVVSSKLRVRNAPST